MPGLRQCRRPSTAVITVAMPCMCYKLTRGNAQGRPLAALMIGATLPLLYSGERRHRRHRQGLAMARQRAHEKPRCSPCSGLFLTTREPKGRAFAQSRCRIEPPPPPIFAAIAHVAVPATGLPRQTPGRAQSHAVCPRAGVSPPRCANAPNAANRDRTVAAPRTATSWALRAIF